MGSKLLNQPWFAGDYAKREAKEISKNMSEFNNLAGKFVTQDSTDALLTDIKNTFNGISDMLMPKINSMVEAIQKISDFFTKSSWIKNILGR